MDIMTPMERIKTTLRLEEPDKVPVFITGGLITSVITGIPIAEYAQNGKKMAEAVSKAYKILGGDVLYLLSDMGIIVEGWGVKVRFPEKGVILHPTFAEFAVKEPEDWEKLEVLDPTKDGRMPVLLEAMKTLNKKYGDTVPLSCATPSTLTTATHCAGMETAFIHMMSDPEALKRGLKTITETIIEFTNAAHDAGLCFTGYLATRASREITTEDQYKEFGAPYDTKVFRQTRDVQHMIHICGIEPMINIVMEYRNSYPNVSSFSWWDRGAKIKLEEAKKKYGTKICLAGGIDPINTLITGTPDDVEKEARNALETAMHEGGFILRVGGEIPLSTPLENLMVITKTVDEYGVY